MGHRVFLYSDISNKYSWHNFVDPVFVKERPDNIDVEIATGIRSVEDVVSGDSPIKAYYVRGLELWASSEADLLRSFRSLRCFVNSMWLKTYLYDHDIDSDLIYPGLDDSWFYDEGKERTGMGALFHARHRTKNHRFALRVSRRLQCQIRMLNKDVINASPDECREFYNDISVWFAPTELEGLHIPPLEASLCGCAVVCSDTKRNGMMDYAVDGENCLIYKARDLTGASCAVRRLLSDPGLCKNLNLSMVKTIKKRIGTRKRNMKKLIRLLKEKGS